MTGPPTLLLAADHRARGIVTVESYRDYLGAVRAALAHCDGILATWQPLKDLTTSGALGPTQRSYLSLNRTGLAGSVFELDDRLVASVERAASAGWSGVKLMTRIDLSDPATAPALELLGRVLEDAAAAGLDAMIEPVTRHEGRMARDVTSIIAAAVVAHDIGAPLLKVPVPDVTPGPARVGAVARVVAAVGVPVLFLGGPRREADPDAVLAEVDDVMAGGGAGMAMGRAIYQDPSPAAMAAAVAARVHGR